MLSGWNFQLWNLQNVVLKSSIVIVTEMFVLMQADTRNYQSVTVNWKSVVYKFHHCVRKLSEETTASRFDIFW